MDIWTSLIVFAISVSIYVWLFKTMSNVELENLKKIHRKLIDHYDVLQQKYLICQHNLNMADEKLDDLREELIKGKVEKKPKKTVKHKQRLKKKV